MWLLIIIVPFLIWLDLHLFRIYYDFVFENEDDFQNSFNRVITPDIFSLFKGEYIQDKFGEFKFKGFLFLCIITIVLEVFLTKGIMNMI